MSEIITVKEFQDSRGSLVPLDAEIPFSIKRVYFVSKVLSQEIVRAGHSHKKNKQALISAKGSCVVSVFDGKLCQTNYNLDSPTRCLILQPEDWHTIHNFSEDCVLLVLASEHYDVNDYIDELKT